MRAREVTTEDGRQTLAAGVRPDVLRQSLVVLVASAALLVVAAVAVPGFYSEQNVFNVFRQAAILGIVTLGQLLVMLVGGIDLSVGAVIGVSAVVLAEVGGSTGEGPVLPAILGVLLLGVAVGLVNGVLITLRSVPPFVATLGMSVLLLGARLAYTNGVPSGEIPKTLRPLGLSGIGVVPHALVLWAVLAVLVWLLTTRTTYGRRLYATGTNLQAARLAGIRVRTVVLSTYVLCSVLAACAGLVFSSYVGYVDRYIGQGIDLDSIAAAVVGGVAFSGGKGGVGGTVLGVFLITILLDFVILLGVDPNLQLVVRGAVIVVAVGLLLRRKSRQQRQPG
jgi:ribose/xylose/arabinose/galactoside ABC-type transport system permease subunit